MKTIRKIALSALTLVFCCALALGLSSIFSKPQKTNATGEIDVLKTARLSSVRGDYLLLATAFDLNAAKAQGADTLVYTINGETYETNTYYSAVATRTDKNDPTAVRTSTSADIYGDEAYSGYMLAVLEIENDITRDNDYEITFAIKSGETTIATGTDLSASVTNRATEGLSFTLNAGGNDYSVSKGTATATDIVIPAVYNDKPVTKIGSFSNINGILSIEIPNSVTSIGGGAFSGCNGLISITIPESVTSIGNSAFMGCYRLVEVYNKSSLNITKGAFNVYGNVGAYAKDIYTEPYTSKISADESGFITYTDGTDKILLGYTGNRATLTIPDDITEIYKYAFYKNRSIYNITISDSVTSIGESAFSMCADNLYSVNIGNGVTSIGSGAFYSCYKLSEITFGENSQLTTIYGTAFQQCDLRSIEIPSGVTSIGYRAFSQCTRLSSISFEENSQLTSIGEEAFSMCNSLTSIEIPSGVTSIGNGAFMGCKRLASITIDDNNAYYTTIDGNLYNKDGTMLIQYAIGKTATEFTVPAGVTCIAYGAFDRGEYLTNITIPDSVTSIEETAFSNCISLTSITIPDGVTSISSRMFCNCYALTDILLHDDITIIGREAFYNCYHLSSVTIGNNVTSIDNQAFYNCYNLVEINNKSSMNITKGSTYNGYIGYYAKNIFTPDSGESKLSTDENGFIIYTDGDDIILIGHIGNDSNLTTPNTITEIYQYAFYNLSGLTSITLSNGVTSIGQYAFAYCNGLTSITIPDSVTNIDNSAFSNCNNLASVYYGGKDVDDWDAITIGSNNNYLTSATRYYYDIPFVAGNFWHYVDGEPTVWTYTDGLTYSANGDGSYKVTGYGTATDTYLVIPKYYNDDEDAPITAIGAGAFQNKTAIVYAAIPDGVTSIGNAAFYGCSGLTSIEIPDSVTSIGSNAFYGCSSLTSITIPDGVTSIGGSAFNRCSALTSIEIPDGVIDISTRTFEYCEGLTSITIPDSVTVISGGAFYYCRGLTSITIPDSITSIGTEAFRGCSRLTSITIPASVTSIGDDVFYNCTGLTSVYYEGTIEDWCNISFGNDNANPLYYANNLYIKNNEEYELVEEVIIPATITNINNTFCGYSRLTSVTFEEGSLLTSIGSSAFNSCSGLSSISIPDSVTSIANSAFLGCSSLTSITIPESVTNIGERAFNYCTNLTNITIPDGVTSIGREAFYNCYRLTNITIPNGVTSIGICAFYGCTELTSITFSGTIAEWSAISKGSNWNLYVSSSCVIHCTDGDIAITAT